MDNLVSQNTGELSISDSDLRRLQWVVAAMALAPLGYAVVLGLFIPGTRGPAAMTPVFWCLLAVALAAYLLAFFLLEPFFFSSARLRRDGIEKALKSFVIVQASWIETPSVLAFAAWIMGASSRLPGGYLVAVPFALQPFLLFLFLFPSRARLERLYEKYGKNP